MTKIPSIALMLCLGLGLQAALAGDWNIDSQSRGSNFAEAMLRMMEAMGLVNKNGSDDNPPWESWQSGTSGWPANGMQGWNSVSPNMMGSPGNALMPGMTAMPGMTNFPGMTTMPGLATMPGIPYNQPWNGQWQNWMPSTPATPNRSPGHDKLDGAWESNTGGLLVVARGRARMYQSEHVYQDYRIHLQERYLWLTPEHGGKSIRYEYREDAGRMVLRDRESNYLLLRRLQSSPE